MRAALAIAIGVTMTACAKPHVAAPAPKVCYLSTFGVKGDRKHDDTAAVSRALNALAAGRCERILVDRANSVYLTNEWLHP